MHRMEKKIPVGIENFADIRKNQFYYVDKTGMIRELLRNWGKVNLFTRPRRFGKSLNMSMLKCFFEIGQDPSLFEGLDISREKELCGEYQGRFPVISITLKGIQGSAFEKARAMLIELVRMEARRFMYLLNSTKLDEYDKEDFRLLLQRDMPDDILNNSLLILSRLLHKYHGQQVLILIDEYDVPLDKANQSGYYAEMVCLLRNMFQQALKGNESLRFAVMTGCLRVSKESIFTGLNHLKILSVTDVRFSQYFGFTDVEVREMLDYYGQVDKFTDVKQWYDGYRFGKTDIYCPWDVINYCDLLRADSEAEPQEYWTNTSDNYIIRRFVDKADKSTQREIENLIAGETIIKEIRLELTYSELDNTIEHLWSVLFMTGYLTQRGKADQKKYYLAIPNYEIRQIFVAQIKEWFHEETRQDTIRLDAFCRAFQEQNVEEIEKQFNQYLSRTISIRDTSVRISRKENFYHGILLGLLSYWEDWYLQSNAETGEGYSDILIESEEEKTGIVIEVKYAENDHLDAACEKALAQIEEKQYAEGLLENGMKKIIKYGIACCKKHCKVVQGGLGKNDSIV